MFLKKAYFPGFTYFTKETCINNYYPANVLTRLDIKDIQFNEITIFYGNNGSGKSTLLNLLVEKIECERKTRFFKNEEWVVGPRGGSLHKLFDECVEVIEVTMEEDEEGKPIKLPFHRKLITSDDIFKTLDSKKEFNQSVVTKTHEVSKEGKDLLDEGYYFRGMQDYNRLRDYNLMCSSKKRFIESKVARKKAQYSNGETAMKYYSELIENDGIYLLDEPENCLSPLFQFELRNLILSSQKYCNCQFIIATHSPFFLSLEGATIYNLDKNPIGIQEWYTLENSIVWYDFFKQYEDLFENNKTQVPLNLEPLTNEEFDWLLNFLEQKNTTFQFLQQLRGNEEWLSRAYYLCKKYPDLEEQDLKFEFGILK